MLRKTALINISNGSNKYWQTHRVISFYKVSFSTLFSFSSALSTATSFQSFLGGVLASFPWPCYLWAHSCVVRGSLSGCVGVYCSRQCEGFCPPQCVLNSPTTVANVLTWELHVAACSFLLGDVCHSRRNWIQFLTLANKAHRAVDVVFTVACISIDDGAQRGESLQAWGGVSMIQAVQ